MGNVRQQMYLFLIGNFYTVYLPTTSPARCCMYMSSENSSGLRTKSRQLLV